MSANIAGVSNISNKWALAQRMAGQANAPEQALRSIFEEAMNGLEGIAHVKFETSLKERVWSKVSPEKLNWLRNTLLLEFCERILGLFSDADAKEALEEHRRTGAVGPVYNRRIQIAYELTDQSIIQTVIQEAKSITSEWIPEIVAAIKEEGIELPEPAAKPEITS